MTTGDPRRRKLLTPLGPAVFLGFLAALVFLARAADRLLGLPPIPPAPYHFLPGLPLIAAGVPLVARSASRFFRTGGTPVPFNPPPRLIEEGPYSRTRNPMMTGLFAVLFGIGFLLQSPAMVVFFVPVFVLLMCLQIRYVEEPELELRFGEDYREYRRRTPMFFPRRGPRFSKSHGNEKPPPG